MGMMEEKNIHTQRKREKERKKDGDWITSRVRTQPRLGIQKLMLVEPVIPDVCSATWGFLHFSRTAAVSSDVRMYLEIPGTKRGRGDQGGGEESKHILQKH